MHAIRQHEFGPPETLRWERLPDPVPGEGQVGIAVEAAGVHFVDTAIRQGRNGGAFPLPELPTIPGREVAGVVEALGPGVDERWAGRRVVAHLGMAGGGYAERAVAAVEALHELPEHVPAEVAVAAIGTGRTAVLILDQAALTADDVVLVTAAAGGLGSLFIQAARGAGALAVALAGGLEMIDRARAVGADVAADYRRDGWQDELRAALGGREPTVLLDGVGGEVGRAALELLGTGGRVLLFGWASGAATEITTADLMRRGLTARWALGPRPGELRDLERRALAEAASGRLVPFVGSRFRLSDAALAHAAIEDRATVGKTVLVP